MPKTHTKKLSSGGARLVAAGKHPVLLGLTPEQHEMIQSAAHLDGRFVTQFLTHYGLLAAGKVLEKSKKSA